MLIVSLSTIPSRFKLLGATLQSILEQDIKIDAVEVWIPKTYRRFPEHAFCIPDVPEGVTVRIADEDYGPATKVLPAAYDYKGKNARILYCDDDRTMPKSWARSFLNVATRKPNCAVAVSGWDIDFLGFEPRKSKEMPRARRKRSKFDMPYRWRRLVQKYDELRLGRKLPKPNRGQLFGRAGFIDIMEGCGGVLVTPEMFEPQDCQIPDRLWAVDDIWLSGMLARKGIGIWTNRKSPMPKEQVDVADPLHASTIAGLTRMEANRACVEYLQRTYGIWQD